MADALAFSAAIPCQGRNEEYVGAQAAEITTRIGSLSAASPLVSNISYPVGWGLPTLCGLFSDDQP